jgi:hypothetical protein
MNEAAAKNCIRCGSTIFNLPSHAGGVVPTTPEPPLFLHQQPEPPRFDAFNPPVAPLMPVAAPPSMGFVAGCCPFCATTYPPILQRQTSTGGWVTFAVLLVTCLPLFWVGLLMKENRLICSVCRRRLA